MVCWYKHHVPCLGEKKAGDKCVQYSQPRDSAGKGSLGLVCLFPVVLILTFSNGVPPRKDEERGSRLSPGLGPLLGVDV